RRPTTMMGGCDFYVTVHGPARGGPSVVQALSGPPNPLAARGRLARPSQRLALSAKRPTMDGMDRSTDRGSGARTPALLWWIIAFKVVKALSLLALGAALLSTRHVPAESLLVEVARMLHVPLSSRMLQRAMAAATSLSPRRELLLAIAAFTYGLLFAVEGIG